MIYGYARVSTYRQGRYGSSLKEQEKLLRENGCSEVYSDVWTGTKANRPQLEALLKVLKKGDTLIVTKLDRMARNIADGIEMIDELNGRGITVNVLNLGVMECTPTGKLIRNVLLAVAEFERDMIYERTQEGRQAAIENGKKMGRPAFTGDLGNLTMKEAMEKYGIKRSTYYKYKRA